MDEGEMFPQENSNEVLERGTMVNPASGKEEAYEECWVDLDPVLLPGESKYQSWVLVAKEVTIDTNIRGMMIRVGAHVEGILRVDDKVTIKRWEWGGSGIGSWKQTSAIGEVEFESPRDVNDMGKSMSMMDEFTTPSGLMWRCVEAFEWN